MRLQKTVLGLLCMAVGLCVVSAAQAEFVYSSGQYTESFTGTVKDTTTWEEYTSNSNFNISQNELLQFNGVGDDGVKGDYTTKTFAIGVGGWFSVEVLVNERQTISFAIDLTNNSGGASARSLDDSYLYGMYGSGYGACLVQAHKNENGGEYGSSLGFSHYVGEKYRYVVMRTSETAGRVEVWDMNDQLKGAQDLTLTGFGDDLYISLYGNGRGGVQFDNIVAVVPEPTTLALLAAGGLALLRRRKA